jgi:hypothetical protein
MKTQLTDLYHDFSGFSHITIESLTRKWKNTQYYPYSMDYGYSNSDFSPALENLWKVIDLLASIMLLVCSRFYGYQIPSKYLDAILTHEKRKQNEPIKLINLAKSDPVRKNIPIFSTLVE